MESPGQFTPSPHDELPGHVQWPLLLSCSHLGPLTFLSSPQLPWFAESRGVSLVTTFPRLCFPCRSVSKLMNLIKKGVLPQDAKPPEDILLLPSLDYLEWISNLPQHLQYQVIHSTPSCSIKTQKEKVRLWEQEGASQRPPEDPGGHPTHCLRQATVTVMSPPPLCMYQGLC